MVGARILSIFTSNAVIAVSAEGWYILLNVLQNTYVCISKDT